MMTDKRFDKVKSLISKNNIDASLISSVSDIIYLTSYSGFSYFEREAFLVITGKVNYLITDGRYSEAVSDIPNFELIEISSENTLDKIFGKLSEKIKKIGIEENNLSVEEFRKIRKHFKTANLKELSNLRIIKDEYEILKIEKACKIGDRAFDYILRKIRKGITEKELAFELEYFIKQKGADISFPPIVAFGKNSSIPHHQTSDRKLKTDNIILLDFGVKFKNYCSDMTRTVFFGKADEKFKKIYNTVLESQQKALEFLKSSIPIKSGSIVNHKSSIPARKADQIARKYIIDQGFSTIPHSLGHGIGIEVHEPPHLSPQPKSGRPLAEKDILKPGMVFSIEPGIYIPGYGGVRIEDIVVLERNASRLLTHSPKEIIEI